MNLKKSISQIKIGDIIKITNVNQFRNYFIENTDYKKDKIRADIIGYKSQVINVTENYITICRCTYERGDDAYFIIINIYDCTYEKLYNITNKETESYFVDNEYLCYLREDDSFIYLLKYNFGWWDINIRGYKITKDEFKKKVKPLDINLFPNISKSFYNAIEDDKYIRWEEL